jgi:hypothetical protein
MKKYITILILFFLTIPSLSFADENENITAKKAPVSNPDYPSNNALGKPEPVTEGFEAGIVPPAGWSAVTNNVHTWKLLSSSHSGSYSADVEYNPELVPQDEWLLTPSGYYSGILSLWSFGSLYWGRDTYDNYNGEVWIVVNGIGGGDDVYVGKVDDDWLGNWVWSQSTFDLDPLLPAKQPVQLGFRYVGVDGAQLAIDDISYNYSAKPPAAIPTLSEWGMILLALILSGSAFRAIHRRQIL